MDKRYQVFISSTFSDLEVERQEVMHALLELDCLPAGMELFPAANESQWDLIKRVIDDSDYYILILGGRYGSIGPDGISYTEMEYRYALETKKPTIAFFHRDPSQIIASKTESTDEGKAKLAAFREAVQKRLCKAWETPQELGSVVSRSLVQLMKSTPAIGWVRANEVPDKDATLELLRLRRKVEELENEIQRSRTSAPETSKGLAQGEELHEVDYLFGYRRQGAIYNSGSYNAKVKLSWNDMFSVLAPHMIDEADEKSLKSALKDLIFKSDIKRLRENESLKEYTLRDFEVHDAAFQTIKVQMRALGLIVKSTKNRSVKDTGTYWTLTPYGDEVMTRLRAIPSGKRESDFENLLGGTES